VGVAAGRGFGGEVVLVAGEVRGEVAVAEAGEGAGLGVEECGEVGECGVVGGGGVEGVAGGEVAERGVELVAVGAEEGELVLVGDGGLQGLERGE
jgi:hypothetical protein